LLFGTGFDLGVNARSTARVGGVDTPVLGIAPQGQFAGLTQANLGPLSGDLSGRGPVGIELIVGGEAANLVGVAIQ